MARQTGQRFFLFVQVHGRDADTAIMRLSGALKQRGLYDDATIVLVGDRGDAGSGLSLDDRALRVPLSSSNPRPGKSPTDPVARSERRPSSDDSRPRSRARAAGLPGRSLRAVLDDTDAVLPASPIYSESLAAYFRFGGRAVYA